MALQLAYNEEATGLEFPAAYHRLTQANLNAGAQGAEMVVSVYKDGAARDAGKSPVHTYTKAAIGQDYADHFAATALDTTNPFAQGYAYLKALPEFEGALDV